VGSKDVSHLTKTASKHTTLFLETDWIYSRLIYHQSVAIKPTTFSLLEPCSLAHDVNDIKNRLSLRFVDKIYSVSGEHG